MGIVKNFIDELAKHEWLAYFVFFWGAMLFLWSLSGIIEWGFDLSGLLGILDMLFNLSEMFAGLLLVIVGIKLLNANFLEAIKNDQLVIYFMLLWAATFLFGGLYSIIDYLYSIIDGWSWLLAVLSGLAGLVAGLALGLFGWKQLKEKE